MGTHEEAAESGSLARRLQDPSPSLRRSLLALICAVYVATCLIHVTAPFLRHHESVSCKYGTFARNFARLGLLESRFTMVHVSCPDMSVFGDWRRHYYPQRPPLSAIGLSLFVRVLGDSEGAIRVSMIVVGVLTILAFHLVAVRLLDGPWPLVATAIFALNPMFLYFGIIAVHYTYGILASLLTWAVALRLQGSRRRVALLFGLVAAGCFTDWPTYFGVLALAIYFWKEGRRLLPVALCLTAVACFALILLHRWSLDPVTGRWLKELLSVGVHHAGVGAITPAAYVYSELRELGLYFTVGVSVAAAVGTWELVRRRSWTPILFALYGLEEVLFIRQAYEHDYLTIFLAPFMALTAAAGLRAIAARPRLRPAALALAALALVQAAWVAGDRFTRTGGNEPGWQAAVEIRKHTDPRDRVLLAMDDSVVDYYADRYVSILDGITHQLTLPVQGPVSLDGTDPLLRYLEAPDPGYDVVVVGAAESALDSVAFFRKAGIGKDKLDAFWFYREDHPLRKLLESRASRKDVHGAYLFYWLRRPR